MIMLKAKGNTPWNKGNKLSEATKKKISLAKKGHKASEATKIKLSENNSRFWLGKTLSEEAKKKISESLKGKKLSVEHKRKIVLALKGRKGKKPSQEARKKMSLSQIGKKRSLETRKKMSLSRKREKCNFWKGGITEENQIIRTGIDLRLWREAVFARDNWTCQKTGERGGKIHAHHIQNFAQFPELRFAIDNGVTLSEKSHREFHKKYGVKNNSKEQIEEFLNT